jgi:hypothetical protein
MRSCPVSYRFLTGLSDPSLFTVLSCPKKVVSNEDISLSSMLQVSHRWGQYTYVGLSLFLSRTGLSLLCLVQPVTVVSYAGLSLLCLVQPFIVESVAGQSLSCLVLVFHCCVWYMYLLTVISGAGLSLLCLVHVSSHCYFWCGPLTVVSGTCIFSLLFLVRASHCCVWYRLQFQSL